jgi:nanoRNase/pAp phosphatase (c-di-AMP/oligoRNAs hydrolase)
VALRRLLWRRTAGVTIASINEVRRADNLRLIKSLSLPLPNLSSLDLSRFTKFAMVDSQPHHSPLTACIPFSLVVDHHPCPPPGSYAQPEFIDVRSDYGATATILANYLKASKIKPNQHLATALFYAIKTDTQNFVRQGQIEDMRAFRWLYPLINQQLLSDIERAPITRGSYRVMLAALNRATFSQNFAAVGFEKLDHPDTLVLAADFVMQIDGVNRAVVTGVFEDTLIVVLRSASLRGSDLGKLAQDCFGAYGSAGGHRNMARAELRLADLDPKRSLKYHQLHSFVLMRIRERLAKRKTPAEPPERK